MTTTTSTTTNDDTSRPDILRIKIKTLAAEARFIRLEERRAKAQRRRNRVDDLAQHRKHVVRRAAREALLAYAWTRGRTYALVEQPESRPVRWGEVARVAVRYGRPATAEQLEQWAKGKAAVVPPFLRTAAA